MFKWFDKWFANKCKQAWEDAQNSVQETGLAINKAVPGRLRAGRDSDSFGTEPITFRMYKASGGWAIEFKTYDNRNDNMNCSLYVVNDEQELGNHISKIITMEALKR